MLRHRLIVSAALVLTLTGCRHGVQRADLSFEPEIARPAWEEGGGPVVLIDEGHANFHPVDGA